MSWWYTGDNVTTDPLEQRSDPVALEAGREHDVAMDAQQRQNHEQLDFGEAHEVAPQVRVGAHREVRHGGTLGGKNWRQTAAESKWGSD